MDFIRYRFIIILLVAALLMGVGSFRAIATDYFPLQVGNIWTYSPSYGDKGDRVDTIIGNEEVNGTPTYIWNRQEAPDDNYNEIRWLAKDDTYLKIYKIWSNEGINPSVIFTPPLIMFKLNPVVGDTWEFEGDLGSFNAKSTFYVESTTDSMTVAAGSFNNCIRVREYNEIIEGGVTEYEYEKKWYAPEVGMIVDRTYTENWNNVEFSQELVSFSKYCESDFDGDKDVDGLDLAELAADPDLLDLSIFAADFGRIDCS